MEIDPEFKQEIIYLILSRVIWLFSIKVGNYYTLAKNQFIHILILQYLTPNSLQLLKLDFV